MIEVDYTLVDAVKRRFGQWELEPGDRVVIVADTGTYKPLLKASFYAISQVTDDPCIVYFPYRFQAYQDIPEVLEKTILRADFMLDIPGQTWTYSPSHSRVMKAVRDGKLKYGRWGGREEDIPHLVLLGPDPVVEERTRRAKEIFDRTTTFRLTSSLGTDLTIGRGNPEERTTYAPTGQAAFAPPLEEVNGVLYHIGALRTRFPGPDPIKRMSEEPVRIVFEQGKIANLDESVANGRFLARWLASWNDPLVYNFAHMNLGVDHRIRLHVLDNLSVHFNYAGILTGIGTQFTPLFGHDEVRQARAHLELQTVDLSVYADDLQVTEAGEFTAESGIQRVSD